jgi:predicted RNase H-like HicB family nuclease
MRMREAKRFYPGVLERAAKGTFAVWFPDFPSCVAAGTSQDQAIQKAEAALAQAVDSLAEREERLPNPSPVEAISLPKESRCLAFVMVGVGPPDPSERVNIYLPKRLIERADARAAALGMSRSSLFGLAVSQMLEWPRSSGVWLPPGTTMPKTRVSRARVLPAAPQRKGRRDQ